MEHKEEMASANQVFMENMLINYDGCTTVHKEYWNGIYSVGCVIGGTNCNVITTIQDCEGDG